MKNRLIKWKIRIVLGLAGAGLCWSFPAHGKSKILWAGTYSHVSGQFEMAIEQWDVDGLSVDIIKKDEPNKIPPYASFVAFIRGRNRAEHRNIREPSCRIVLKLVADGVIVYDHCGGSTKDAGLYRKKSG